MPFLKVNHRWMVFFGIFCCLGAAQARLVSEQEPNNPTSLANPVLCGDTVVCGILMPANEADNFRVHLMRGDSLVATTFSCNGSETNTLLALFDDRDSLLANDDDGGPNYFSEIRWEARHTGNYVLHVARYINFPDSAYNLAIGCEVFTPEPYDLCTTPRIIPALPYYDEGNTRGATHQCGTLSPDVFYRFHNPILCNLFLTLCTTMFHGRVQILGGCCTQFLDDGFPGCDSGSTLTSFGLAPGDYFIMVEGMAADDIGPYSLEVAAQLPGCPTPGPIVVTRVGNYPMLDWPELVGPSYYIVWQCSRVDGQFEHLGITTNTFYIDSTGFTGTKRFYQVSAVCPW